MESKLNFLLELRTAARDTQSMEHRVLMNGAANELEKALINAYEFCSRKNMIVLNGAWAFAERVYKNRPPNAEPTPPQSDAGTEPMRMAA